MNLKHYVEEIWLELDYEKGLNERSVILPIKTRDNYIPLPWVKKYKFFDLNNQNNKTNITNIINNKNYNPTYFMDDQIKILNQPKINLEIVHFIKITLIEINYLNKKEKEIEVIFPIKNKEKYIPTPLVKNYKFIDYLKININGKEIIDKTPINETITYTNPIFDTSHLKNKPLIDKSIFETISEGELHKSNIKTLTKKKYIKPTKESSYN